MHLKVSCNGQQSFTMAAGYNFAPKAKTRNANIAKFYNMIDGSHNMLPTVSTVPCDRFHDISMEVVGFDFVTQLQTLLTDKDLMHMTSSHSMRQHSQSSAAPSANSQTFLSMVGLSLALSEGLIFNVTVLYSSLLVDGFLCFFWFPAEWNWRQVHGGMSMVLAIFWDVSQLHLLIGSEFTVPYACRIKNRSLEVKNIN